jgi:hypothetical protein
MPHAVGDFDGCISCPGCPLCNYDCCSDCTYDKSVHKETCPWCEAQSAAIKYLNRVCNCEGHTCSEEVS